MARRHLLVDLSNNNGHVNLQRVRNAGIVGVWHKASEGMHFVDSWYAPRRAVAHSLGLVFGAYHFARFSSMDEAVVEAKHFASIVGRVGRHDLAPVLDLETNEGLSPVQLEHCARAFMHTVHNHLGVWPLFYSFPDFIEHLNAKKVLGRGLWLASFGRNDGKEYPYRVPKPFHRALAHQFTSDARIPGVDGKCDLSSAPRLYPIMARGLRGL